MEVPITSYYLNLRTVLADPGVGGVYAWQDEQLAAGLQTVIQTGLGPKGMALNGAGDLIETGTETENYDARGFLVFQVALLMLGGQLPFSHKTRALSVIRRPEERELTLDHIRRQIKRLESTGDPHGNGGGRCFGIWQDYENALEPTTEPVQIA